MNRFAAVDRRSNVTLQIYEVIMNVLRSNQLSRKLTSWEDKSLLVCFRNFVFKICVVLLLHKRFG